MTALPPPPSYSATYETAGFDIGVIFGLLKIASLGWWAFAFPAAGWVAGKLTGAIFK